jgi:hypothetical protein
MILINDLEQNEANKGNIKSLSRCQQQPSVVMKRGMKEEREKGKKREY